eukprot:4397193-Karenia_brevis.AAC.1
MEKNNISTPQERILESGYWQLGSARIRGQTSYGQRGKRCEARSARACRDNVFRPRGAGLHDDDDNDDDDDDADGDDDNEDEYAAPAAYFESA